MKDRAMYDCTILEHAYENERDVLLDISVVEPGTIVVYRMARKKNRSNEVSHRH